MSIHAPVIRQPHVPMAFPVLPTLVVAVILFAVLAVALALTQPVAQPTADAGVWMTEQRHGEIDAGRNGPHPDVLIYRQGEINAANQ